MTSPRDPLASAAAELGSLVDMLKTRAKDALGDPSARVELSRQAEGVAATAAAAASTVLSGIATAAQTVGSVLDGWAETHRAGTVPGEESAPEGSLTATSAVTGSGAEATTVQDAPTDDEGVAWD